MPHSLGRERRIGRKADAIDNQRVAFPAPDGVAIVSEIGIVGVFPSIGVDVADLHIGLDDDGHFTGREQEFDRVRLAHDPRHAGRDTVGRRVVLRRIGLVGLLHGLVLRRERNRRGLPAAAIARHFPHADKIGQVRDRGPGAERRFHGLFSRALGRALRDGGHRKNQTEQNRNCYGNRENAPVHEPEASSLLLSRQDYHAAGGPEAASAIMRRICCHDK